MVPGRRMTGHADRRTRSDGDRPRPTPGRDTGEGAVALHQDGGLCQLRASEPRRGEGGRPPVVELIVRDGHDLPLLRVHEGRGRHIGEAPRLSRLPRHTVPAGQPGASVPDDAARLSRVAGVPEPHEGPGRGRLFHRLRGAGRGGAELREFGQRVSARPLRDAGRRQAVHQPSGGRGAGRGVGVGDDSRAGARRHEERAVGGRPEPAEPGQDHPGYQGALLEGDVRRERVAGGGRQVRQASAGCLRGAQRRPAAHEHRRDVQRPVPAAPTDRAGGAPRLAAAHE